MLIAWTQSFTLGGAPAERRTLMATVRLEPYERRVVRPHERTHEGPKADRLRLTRAVGVNLSPVFGLYPDAEGAAWRAAAVSGPPDAELTDREGTAHRLWRIADPAALDAVSRAMADRWILIADGHHRYETALAYSRERPEADRVMMGLTALEDPGLVVLPTHRTLTEWPEGAAAAFAETPVDDLDGAAGRAGRGAAEPGAGLRAGAPRPGRAPHRAPRDRPLAGGRTRHGRAGARGALPAFGEDQAALTARGVLGYVKDAAEAWRLVREGGAAAALVVRPTTKAQVAAVAEAGETMPQKSTYFFPKLLTGVAYHPLDGD